MDAYIDYLRQANEARLNELRREANECHLARSLTRQAQTRRGLFVRFSRRAARRAAARPVAKPVGVLRPKPVIDEDTRRIA